MKHIIFIPRLFDTLQISYTGTYICEATDHMDMSGSTISVYLRVTESKIQIIFRLFFMTLTHYFFNDLNQTETAVCHLIYTFCTLQMFCLLKPQMNVCEPNPNTTSSNFNRLESLTKIFCFHAISKDICVLFQGSLVILFIILLINSVVFTPSHL